MANLTLSIDDELLRRARRYAAQRDTSVNRLVRDHLERLTLDREQRLTEAREFVRLSDELSREILPWTRDELHDR